MVDDHFPEAFPLEADAERDADAGGEGGAVRRGRGLLNPAFGEPEGVLEPDAIA